MRFTIARNVDDGDRQWKLARKTLELLVGRFAQMAAGTRIKGERDAIIHRRSIARAFTENRRAAVSPARTLLAVPTEAYPFTERQMLGSLARKMGASRAFMLGGRVNLDRRADLFARFDRVTRVPLLGLAVAFLVVLALPDITRLPPASRLFLNTLAWLIWGIFAVELLVKVYLAPDRRRYLRSHWPDVLTLAFPFVRVFRLLPIVIALLRTWEQAELVLRRRTFSVLAITSFITIILAALLVYAVERSSAGTIRTFGDALWWAVATITTVGYGDVYPQTAGGRVVAVFLMLTGISLFGVLAARVAAFFVKEDTREDEDPKLNELLKRLDRIEAQLARQNLDATNRARMSVSRRPRRSHRKLPSNINEASR